MDDVFENGETFENLDGPSALRLVAGTAWLFADEGTDRHVGYPFVDEAGQVAA